MQSVFSLLISDGHVSLPEIVIQVPVKILRDTGAAESFIVNNILPFSNISDSGNRILMWDMGLNVLPVPVHKLGLVCGLVQGVVEMGVRPRFQFLVLTLFWEIFWLVVVCGLIHRLLW